MSKVIIEEKDIPVGKETPWPICDDNGRVLLKTGSIISSKRQIDSLLMRGACFIKEIKSLKDENELANNKPNGLEQTPFDRFHTIISKLSRIFAALDKNHPSTHIKDRTASLAKEIQDIFEENSDAMLGAVHLIFEYDYTLVHPVHVSILCEMIGKAAGLSKEKRISNICAALTCNFSMNQLQEELQNQKGKLSERQLKEVQNHPKESTMLLKKAGVEDKVWLRCILQHHEKIDKSGYPFGASGDEISKEAKILAIADTYAAMVSARTYRDRMVPSDVLKEMFMGKGAHCDEELSLLFIRELGVYPPGGFVSLVNGETAIITNRGEELLHPIVSSYISSKGAKYTKPYRRDCSLKPYAIKGICKPDKRVGIDLNRIWHFDGH